MAWYDKWQKEGYKVRGSVDVNLNEFTKERNYKYETTTKGEYIRNLEEKKPKDAPSTWLPSRIPIRDENGVHKFTNDYLERDVYIECASGNKIFCFTADEFNCRHHIYECELSTGRWNKLREFYNLHVGKESDYYYLDEIVKKGKKVKVMIFHNDLMLDKIKEDGRLYDFIESDTEIFFKCDDMELLATFMKPKMIKKSKNPFHRDYLDWTNNVKAKVPNEMIDKLKSARQSVYGMIEFGSKEALTMAQDVAKLDNEFLEKHNITERTRLDAKIKDTDRIIYHLGLWDAYVNVWQST